MSLTKITEQLENGPSGRTRVVLSMSGIHILPYCYLRPQKVSTYFVIWPG